jgi:hypothetical protein
MVSTLINFQNKLDIETLVINVLNLNEFSRNMQYFTDMFQLWSSVD